MSPRQTHGMLFYIAARVIMCVSLPPLDDLLVLIDILVEFVRSS